jgi:flagellar biosynthesis protein FlhG
VESIAVTGAKGGVGKSNLVVNLAVLLARSGRRVLVVDGDLGLANLDVLLGLVPRRTIEHLVHGDARIEELLIEGPEGIRILPAASGIPQLTRLGGSARSKLLKALAEGAALVDDVLVDTGAGLGDATLSLQLAASRVIVVTTTEPTSLVDAYASLKVLWDADPDKPVDLIVNKAASEAEALRAYKQIAQACSHFLQREPGWLGAVYHDPNLQGAVRRQKALVELFPSSRASRCLERIALRLTMQPVLPAGAGFWPRLGDVTAKEPDSVERRRFLESHVDLVRYIALRLAARLPATVEVDDLIHDGVLGLFDAVEKFDPRREVRFRTYAERRVRGAILDGLRQRDWQPRTVRRGQRELEEAIVRLGSLHGRAASEEELASAMGLELGQLRQLLQDANTGPIVPLDQLTHDVNPTLPPAGDLPHDALEHRELLECLADELPRLPERERRVLELYYHEGLNMKEVGAVLGVTESRVCQVHAQAAARLRAALSIRLSPSGQSMAGVGSGSGGNR